MLNYYNFTILPLKLPKKPRSAEADDPTPHAPDRRTVGSGMPDSRVRISAAVDQGGSGLRSRRATRGST